MATTSTSLFQKGSTTNTVCKRTNDYQIVLGTINGAEIPSTAIANFILEEDIFSLLPAASFTVVDNGRYFDSGDMYVGQTVYIQFSPKRMFAQDSKITTYSSIKMKIMSINVSRANLTGNSQYTVVCVYDALGILAAVQPYPPKSTIQTSLNATSESSINAIKAQLNAGGLDATADITTSDSMVWLNTRNKVYQAVNKFLNHSWVSEDDALLAYTSFVDDKHFNENSSDEDIEEAFVKKATITSCNTLLQKASEATYIPAKRTGEHENCYRFAAAYVHNAAGVSTIKNDAYKQTAYVYDPLGILNFDNLTDFEEADIGISSLTNLQSPRVVVGMLKREFDNPEVSMTSNTSKIDTLYNFNTQIVDGGMHFEETHQHYDVAPAHNKAILASFFNTTIDITFDVNQQNAKTLQSNSLPYIGQKVTLDFGHSDDEISENYSGDYIVAQLKYIINNNEPAKCVMTVVADGTYKKPSLTT